MIPCTFSGEDEDAYQYLIDFENVANANKWDAGIALAQLLNKFTDSAKVWREVYVRTLPPGVVLTYDMLKDALQKAFYSTSSNKMVAQLKAQNYRQQLNQLPETYVYNKIALLHKWSDTLTQEELVTHLLHGLTASNARRYKMF